VRRGLQQGGMALYLSVYFKQLNRFFGWSKTVQILVDQLVGSWGTNALFLLSSKLLTFQTPSIEDLKTLPSLVQRGVAVWGPTNALGLLLSPERRIQLSLLVSFCWGVYLSMEMKKSKK
jgi:hypothetical protein